MIVSAGLLATAPAALAVKGPGQESGDSVFVDISDQSVGVGVGAGLTTAAGEDVPIQITIAKIIKQFMTLLGTIAIVLILYAGFLWMTAAGNEEQITKAKKIILNATIGLIIIMMAWAIAAFVIDRVTWSISGAPAQDAYWLW